RHQVGARHEPRAYRVVVEIAERDTLRRGRHAGRAARRLLDLGAGPAQDIDALVRAEHGDRLAIAAVDVARADIDRLARRVDRVDPGEAGADAIHVHGVAREPEPAAILEQ